MSVFDCMSFLKHMLNCKQVYISIVSCLYLTQAADWSKPENFVWFVIWNRNMLNSKINQMQLLKIILNKNTKSYSTLYKQGYIALLRVVCWYEIMQILGDFRYHMLHVVECHSALWFHRLLNFTGGRLQYCFSLIDKENVDTCCYFCQKVNSDKSYTGTVVLCLISQQPTQVQ